MNDQRIILRLLQLIEYLHFIVPNIEAHQKEGFQIQAPTRLYKILSTVLEHIRAV